MPIKGHFILHYILLLFCLSYKSKPLILEQKTLEKGKNTQILHEKRTLNESRSLVCCDMMAAAVRYSSLAASSAAAFSTSATATGASSFAVSSTSEDFLSFFGMIDDVARFFMKGNLVGNAFHGGVVGEFFEFCHDFGGFLTWVRKPLPSVVASAPRGGDGRKSYPFYQGRHRRLLSKKRKGPYGKNASGFSLWANSDRVHGNRNP